MRRCNYYSQDSCSLGYHDGKPSYKECILCIVSRKNTPDRDIYQSEFLGHIKSAAAGASRFTANGFPTVNAETLEARQTVCKSCDMWDSTALSGTGRCRKCGCSTWAKLRMATEKCPIGKW